ncbi:Asp23/Gls24 family envelope stress response protein [Limosilactobacillus equigenerosi]|uniref:Alkaline shock protein n=1 Tax=Limosilactobacillus equigenerosi DSM 18793 = JCM 14505 TaxID=1423742 RepID=A0A0R1USJ2_9LACO|nr:Asp23/Gls24 family envelope stress response protein [Limosilactobacillus equigenerosi]KRL93954.1 Alkaline shock protein [Limosilactobacillus equigenerosi DSM 18793 = JCM 14505]
MAEESTIELIHDNDGKIILSPQTLEFIAGIAASEVDGVSKMHGSLANNVSELLGRSDHRRGVKVDNQPEELVIDVDVYLEFGVSVPQVAAEIQTNVAQQVKLMTDLTVSQVNVHVQGIVMTKQEQQVDPNNIFADRDEEGNA